MISVISTLVLLCPVRIMKLLCLVFLFSVAVGNSTVQSELICSDQPIVALVGDDVILPCHLEPPISVRSETVEWTRPDLDPKYVHVHGDGRLVNELQNPSYHDRTRLFVDQLMNGNVSMKIFEVKLSDTGQYKCFLPSIQKEASIKLFVRESDVIGSHEPVKVTVGQDAILPCHLEPPMDVTTLTVEWERNDKKVHVYRSRKDDLDNQDEHFKDRTSLFHDEMKKGNISLKLTNVAELDERTYTCFVPRLQSKMKKGSVTLIVEPVEKSDDRSQTNNKTGDTGVGPGGTAGIVIVIVSAVFAVICIAVCFIVKKRGRIKSEVTHKAVKVTVHQDAILPCHLEPPIDVTTLTVEWERNEKEVHVYRSMRDDLDNQDEHFKDRTSLFHDEMTKGNISLKLTNVTELDEGTYTCFVPTLQSKMKKGSVTLIVEPVEKSEDGSQTNNKRKCVCRTRGERKQPATHRGQTGGQTGGQRGGQSRGSTSDHHERTQQPLITHSEHQPGFQH